VKATTVFELAAALRLTAEEICETVTATLDRLPSDAMLHCVDELAKRLLEKERL
jgi:hypothetical protein